MWTGECTLYGRDSERARIDQVIDDLKGGREAGLVLAGGPGMGKTSLLRYASRRADGIRILTAQGVPAEASMPFAGLHELLKPILDLLPKIPDRQAAALSAGLALTQAEVVDQLGVAAGTLSLLAAAGQQEQLLVIVDDLDLLDPTSREAVLFAARRSGSEGVGMLLSTSADEDGSGLPRCRIEPLDAGAGFALMNAVSAVPVAAMVAEYLVEATGGTPLALVEAPGVLGAAQLAGAEPLPSPVPVGPMVARAYTSELAGLSEDRRMALLVAAAAGDTGLGRILHAIGALGLPPDTLTAAEADGLVTVVCDVLTFRHPLLRAVVYHEAAVAQRRAAHRALALVTTPERRAWHLGVAALAPDEPAGDELERTAADNDQLCVGDAARLMERAAELTTEDDVRARRYVAAAELWQLAGVTDRVRHLLDKAGRLTGDLRLRAQAQSILAQLEVRAGRPVQARRMLVREAARVRGTDPAGAALMLLDAAEAGCVADEPRDALVAVHRAVTLAGHGPAPSSSAGRRPVPLATLLAGEHAAVLARCGKLSEARALLDGCRTELERAVLDADLPTGWRWTARVGYPALLARLAEFDAAWRVLEELIARARARGVLGLLPGLLVERAEVSLRIGDWDGGEEAAAEAAELATRAGQHCELAGALVFLARLAAARGRRDECLGQLRRARETSRMAGLSVPIAAVEGLLELGAGDFEAAYARLAQVVVKTEAGSAPDHGRVPWVADLVEAAVRVDQAGRVRRLLTETTRRAAGPAMPLARSAALLAGDDAEEAERLFGDALRARRSTTDPFEHARTELCFGEWLKDHGRPDEAGPRLDAALAVFTELGAWPWAQRARGTREELPGESPGEPAIGGLTAQESRVSALVGHGATNREAAQALFVSPKTIEFHLRSVYRKLGVRSRAELAHLVGQSTGSA